MKIAIIIMSPLIILAIAILILCLSPLALVLILILKNEKKEIIKPNKNIDRRVRLF